MNSVNLPKWLCDNKIAISRNEGKRMIHNGLIWLNGEQIKQMEVEVKAGDEIQIPAKRLKVVIEP
jgi:ribosomal 50S subunit-recycling heat shock protein